MRKEMQNTKKTTLFKACLPDGSVVFRKSAHQYTHIVAVKETERNRLSCLGHWFPEWRTGKESAEKRAKYWLNCPATKQGSRFATEVIEVEVVE